MRKTALFASCVGLTLFASACTDPVTAPAEPAESASLAAPSFSAAIADDVGTQRLQLSLPGTDVMTDQYVFDACASAINGSDYACAPTQLVDFYLNSFYSALAAEPANTILLYSLSADLIPTYDALFFQTAATPQYFGYNGEYSDVMMETERDIKRFWDIPSSDIQVLGMHGSMLLDAARVARVYRLFGYPAATANAFAAQIRDALLSSVVWNGGDHPFLTYNAFASGSKKIVMGDGVLDFYAQVGYADVAPQAIFAHEFAHQIQFANGYFQDDYSAGWDAPEQTRYTEMMADAYAAYYMTHKRGLAMNKHRVAQFVQVFFETGDCSFSSSGHHGTPNQRTKAAQFGFDIADSTQKKGHIMGAEEFYQLFMDAFPGMILPDAS